MPDLTPAQILTPDEIAELDAALPGAQQDLDELIAYQRRVIGAHGPTVAMALLTTRMNDLGLTVAGGTAALAVTRLAQETRTADRVDERRRVLEEICALAGDMAVLRQLVDNAGGDPAGPTSLPRARSLLRELAAVGGPLDPPQEQP